VNKAIYAFYSSKDVIPTARRRALILISDEMKNGIVEVADQLKIAFGLEKLFFIFASVQTRNRISEELKLGDKILPRSVVMPWKHSHHVICECLSVSGRNRDKYVCTSNGAHVPIRVAQWQSWGDLEIVGIKECEEEWEGMSKEQKKEKALQEELKFYKGESVSWYNFFCHDRGYNQVMERECMAVIMEDIRRRAQCHDRDADKVPTVPLVYHPGAGGTTLGRHILWELRKVYKCAVISKITDTTVHQICQVWEAEEELQEGRVLRKELKPVILFADNLPSEHPSHNIYHLSKQLFLKQIEYHLSKPVVIIIHCRRYDDPIEGDCQLTQNLKPNEKEWIEKKNDELEKQKLEGVEIETLIAFLSLRHEFDKARLQDTVQRCVQNPPLKKKMKELLWNSYL
jgi:hypothetical protein